MEKEKQYMILTLPSSGSDWLAGCIKRCAPGLEYYEKEFFNPICNLIHRESLAGVFGCEMLSNYKNIGRQWSDEELDSVYRDTWERYHYNFDKETYVAMNAGWFAKRFQCIVLRRKFSSMFPPNRTRVWAWYDAIFASLVENGAIQWEDVDPVGTTLLERCSLAHQVMLRELEALRVPRVDYDFLMQENVDRIARVFSGTWVEEVASLSFLAEEIVKTRQPQTKNWLRA